MKSSLNSFAQIAGWSSMAGRAAAAALFVAACGPAAPSDGGVHPSVPVSVSSASAATVVAEPPAAYPTAVKDLATAVPKDATMLVSVPGDVLKAPQLAFLDTLLPTLSAELAAKSHLPDTALLGAIRAFDGAAIFAMPNHGDDGPPFAAVLRFRESKPVVALLEAAKLTKIDDVHWVADQGRDSMQVAWLAASGIVIVSADKGVLDAALATLSGRAPSFTDSPLFKAASPGEGFLVADLARLVPEAPDLLGPGSRLSVVMGGKGTAIEFREYGVRVPRLGAVLAPIAHEALAKLPAGASFAIDLSMRRRSGKTLRDLVTELGRTSQTPDSRADDSLASMADGLLTQYAKMNLDDLDRALGDEVAFGIYMDAKGKAPPERRFKESGAMLVTVAVRDDKVARSFIDAIARIGKGKKGITSSAGKLTVDLGDSIVRVETQKGSVAIAVGAKQATTDALKALSQGTKTLGASPTFVDYKKRALKESHLAMFGDMAELIRSLGPALGDDAQLKALTASASVISTDLVATASDKGLELTVSGDGGAAIVGTVGALGVYGVRQYLVSSKTAEAKNTLGAISRGAVASFEREQGTATKVAHALCRSAVAVPSTVPRGVKFAPSADPGKDFQTGDQLAGWKCLKFDMIEPFYYQYDYRMGGNYKGPARGGPNPGPNGFEASAEGDLDGDGKTSLFTRTGKFKADGTIELSKEVFISDESE